MAAIKNTSWYVDFGDGSTTGYYAITKWATATAYTVGQIRRPLTAPSAANERAYICIVAGTSVTEPTWTFTKGAIDAGTVESWQECTGQAALNGDATTGPIWVAASTYLLGMVIMNTARTGYFIATSVSGSGTTAGSQPAGLTTPVLGATTTDNAGANQVIWTCIKASGTAFASWGAPFSFTANSLVATWGAAGDTFYWGDNHAETQASALTLTFPGTAALPNNAFCVSHTGSTPPVTADLATTATITTTTNVAINVNGHYYINGVSFFSAGTSGNGNVQFLATGAGAASLENCAVRAAAGSAPIAFGSTTVNAARKIRLLNTTLAFQNVGNTVVINSCDFEWRNTPSAISGAALPTTFFAGATGLASNIVLDGVDFSALGSGKTLVGAIGAPQVYNFVNCKFGTSSTVAATPTEPGGAETYVTISDSANTTYRQEKYAFEGILTTDTVDIRAGGASDGTTPISWEVVTTANANLQNPFTCMDIAKWNGTTGSPITVSVPVMSNATLTNADIWLEAEALDNASFPISSLTSGRVANLLPTTSPTNWPLDVVSIWTTTGVSGPVQQTLSVTFTPQQVGYIRVKVRVAKLSQTVRIDPLLQGF